MILMQSPKGSFIFFDYVVVFLAIVANCIVLTAVLGGRFGLSGYRRFLISLTVSDIYICLVNMLTFVYQIWMLYSATSSAERCGANFLRALQLAGFFANLLNLCGMSVDHFFGIVYPMQYRYLMSKSVARMAVIFIWILSFCLAFLDYPVNMILYSDHLSSTQENTVQLDLRNQDLFQPNSSTQDLSSAISPTMNGFDFSTLSYYNPTIHSDDETATNSLKNVTQATLEKLNESETKAPEELIRLADDSPKTDGIVLETADIESLLESMINQENPLDFNYYDNDTNNSNPITRFLLVLQTDSQNDDWCTFFSTHKMWLEVCVMVLTLLCFAFLIICYGIIFKKVSESVDTSGRSTRKLVVTTIILLGAFMICWLPFMTFETAMLLIFQYDRDAKNHQTKTFLVNFFFMHNMFNSLLLTYPLVDPIIYAARVPAVQRYILLKCSKFLPCCKSCLHRLDSRQSGGVGFSKSGIVTTNSYELDYLHPNRRRNSTKPTFAGPSSSESTMQNLQPTIASNHVQDFSSCQRKKAHSVCGGNVKYAVDAFSVSFSAYESGNKKASAKYFRRYSLTNCYSRRDQAGKDGSVKSLYILSPNQQVRSHPALSPKPSRTMSFSCCHCFFVGRSVQRNRSFMAENSAKEFQANVTRKCNTDDVINLEVTDQHNESEQEWSGAARKFFTCEGLSLASRPSIASIAENMCENEANKVIVFDDDDNGSIAYTIHL